jgi:hypothetical protein
LDAAPQGCRFESFNIQHRDNKIEGARLERGAARKSASDFLSGPQQPVIPKTMLEREASLNLGLGKWRRTRLKRTRLCALMISILYLKSSSHAGIE